MKTSVLRIASVSMLLAALAGLACPAASACRIGPTPIAVPVWERAPAPDQVRPGEVALEIAFPDRARLIEPSRSDEIVVITCNPDQQMLFQVIRVLAGDSRGAEFVIVPSSAIIAPVAIDPATGKPVEPTGPQHWFVVGTLNLQTKYAVAVDDPAAVGNAAARPGENVHPAGIDRALPALNPRWPPQ